jgi:ubiquinone/menaquinone biosynthesis C-methylase UbiE
MAFDALQRVRQPFSVILTDISAALLAHAECSARELGVLDRCSFLRTPAETLDGIEDESVDVLTSRAVLAYVPDKASAARNFYRVLRRGGRLSLGEQENGNTAYLKLLQRWRALQLPSTLDGIRRHPFTNFTERDIVQLFRKAGFVNLHMELHMDVKAGAAMPWSTFTEISPRPGAPCLREVFEKHFTLAEAALLEARIRPEVEAGTLVSQNLIVYLTAEKAARRNEAG